MDILTTDNLIEKLIELDVILNITLWKHSRVIDVYYTGKEQKKDFCGMDCLEHKQFSGKNDDTVKSFNDMLQEVYFHVTNLKYDDDLDVWVSVDNTCIVDRQIFSGNRSFDKTKTYSSEEIGLFLKTKATKWRLGNFDKAHVVMERAIREFNNNVLNTKQK